MSKKKTSLFVRIPTISDDRVRIELGRAHILVTLLAASLIVTLLISLVPGYAPDQTMTVVAVVLLSLVALFSLSLAVALRQHR